MTVVPSPRRRLDLTAASIAAVIFVVSICAYTLLTTHYRMYYWSLEDLRVYQLGGKVALHDGPLYTKAFPSGLPFLYTPFAALLFALVSGAKFALLKVLVTVANILAVIAATWLSFGLAGPVPSTSRDRTRRIAGTLFISALAIWLDPVSQTLSYGQINLLIMLLVLADLTPAPFRNTGGRRWWKGAGVGIAGGIKLTPLAFSGYLLVTRRFRAFGVSMLALAATIGFSFIFLPEQSTQYWIDGKFNAAGHLGSGYGANQSLYGMILRLTHKSPHFNTVWLVAAALVGVGGLLLAAWAHRRGDELLAICVCAVTGLLVSPISWNHHWVWAVPVLVWASARLPRDLPRRWRRVAWLVAAAVFAVFVDVPHHVAMPTHGAKANITPDLSLLTHVTGWMGFMPMYGNDGYYWSGTQIIVGNLYVVFGLVFLLAAFGYLVSRRTPVVTSAVPHEELTPAATGSGQAQQPGRRSDR
jgi:alpha-1,2-mannosyltransferase